MIGVAVAAVGLFLLRATLGRSGEILVREYSEDWRPWNRSRALRVRLDVGRLRAHSLSKDDVIKALTPSGIVDSRRPDPPPGVVFMTRYDRPDRCENIVLKASPEGEVVRLKDVAKVDPDW